MVIAEARSYWRIAQAPLMYAKYVFVWVMCCSACKFVGRAWGCMLTVLSLAACFFYHRPLCLSPWQHWVALSLPAFPARS